MFTKTLGPNPKDFYSGEVRWNVLGEVTVQWWVGVGERNQAPADICEELPKARPRSSFEVERMVHGRTTNGKGHTCGQLVNAEDPVWV